MAAANEIFVQADVEIMAANEILVQADVEGEAANESRFHLKGCILRSRARSDKVLLEALPCLPVVLLQLAALAVVVT